MARERIISADSLGLAEDQLNRSLRPTTLDECIGTPQQFEKLRIALTAAKQRSEPMEHVLLHGPPGLGKTTLAHVIANEMGTSIRVTSGPALPRAGDLMGILTNLERGDLLFIDEIHRLPISVEEFLYPAIEEFKVDFTVDSGPHARTINIPLKPFTLIGATTRAGLISAPLRSRFGIVEHLDYWSEEHLFQRVERSAAMMSLKYDEEALWVISRRARGTPRIANRLLRRVRDFAQVKSTGKLTIKSVEQALELEGVDHLGLDSLDHKYLRTLLGTYNGGPAGVEAMAATLGEARDTLEDVVEPFLLRAGLLARTRQGRVATRAAYSHLGLTPPAEPVTTLGGEEPTLFDGGEASDASGSK
jgi:Holliday junction DNA helicase RuvB